LRGGKVSLETAKPGDEVATVAHRGDEACDRADDDERTLPRRSWAVHEVRSGVDE